MHLLLWTGDVTMNPQVNEMVWQDRIEFWIGIAILAALVGIFLYVRWPRLRKGKL